MSAGHWVREIVDAILERGEENIVIHTGKTPSGPIHIGAEREQFICSAIQRELERRGRESTFNFIVDSFDPIKSIPAGLHVPDGFEAHIGRPLSDIPDPFGCHESYAHHFAEEFIACQEKLGVSPNILYTHELYGRREMKDAVRTVLRKLGELREIHRKYVQQDEDKEEGASGDWNPVMVVCERCGKIASRRKEVAPNRVTSWDLERDEITYTCPSCGHEGRGGIDDLRMKLSWRVDWSAKWAVFRVSCEPAGKDHCVKDGAYEMGLEVCRRIFGFRGPLRVPYEWLTLGGHAMKTHKGITFTPMEWLRIAPPEALRYMILSVDLMRHIAFVPDRIPDIVDNYDRLERIYFGTENPSGTEELESLRDLYEICTVGGVPGAPPTRLPYKFAVIMVQLESLLGHGKILSKSIDYASGLYHEAALSDSELMDLETRLSMAKNWLLSYAPQHVRFRISQEAPSHCMGSETERGFVKSLISILERDLRDNDLQNEIFNTARSMNLEIGKAFEIIYKILLGAESGPRLGPLLTALDKEWVLARLRAALQ